MDSLLRVALVSSSYHPHIGGVEEHVRHVAEGLQSRGHEVEVWTVDRGAGVTHQLVDGCMVRYLPTPLPARSARGLASFAGLAPQAVIRWMRAFARFRPDVLNVQCFGPNGLYGGAVAAVTRTPLVVTSHGETFADEHGVFDRSTLLRAGLRRAVRLGAVTACSSLVADDLRFRFGAADVQVIPNGVHLRPTPSGQPPPVAVEEQARPILLGVGRLVPQKGFDVLLEAAAESRHHPWVWFVGEGAEQGRLEELASRLGIRQRVTFFGRRTATEVRAFMAAADALVVPSRAEAFGIVVLEAWASGTPVIATIRGGPASFVTDGQDGILIDPEHVPSVTSAIDTVLADETLSAGLVAQGAQTVRSYSWSRVVDGYLAVYGKAFAPAASVDVSPP